MKEKILNLLKSDLFFSVVINLIIMFFCIQVTSFSYDDSKDFYNSLYIGQYHYYYSYGLNYILTTIIGSVQFILPGFNGFVLAQILLSYLSFTSITFVFANKFNKKKSFIFTLLLNILFSLNHYADIHSSKTAAILLAAGFLLVLNAIHNKKYSLSCWVGVVLIAFGSFFDYNYFFIALGFAVAFFFADMIAKRKYKIAFQKFFWYFRPYLLMFIFVSLVAVGLNQYSYSVNNSSEEASNYYKYSQLTDSINNLPYPNYSDYKEQFNEIGISTESDYELLKNGYYDDEHYLNNNALLLVSQIQNQENSKNVFYELGIIFIDIFNHIAVFDCFAIIILCFLVIGIVYIVLHKRRFVFFPVFYLIAAIVSSVLIRYFYSGATYLIYGIWLFLFVFLLYSFNFEQFKPKKSPSQLRMRKGSMFISGVFVLCLFMCYCTVYQTNANPIKESEKPSRLFSEIDRHPDRYYVLDPITANECIKYTDNYIHPLWGFKRSFLDNIDGFQYFHKDSVLRKRNMSENIYEAVLNSKKIYVIDKYITFRKERYFTEYYADDSKSAVYQQVNELNGYKIYEVNEQ